MGPGGSGGSSPACRSSKPPGARRAGSERVAVFRPAGLASGGLSQPAGPAVCESQDARSQDGGSQDWGPSGRGPWARAGAGRQDARRPGHRSPAGSKPWLDRNAGPGPADRGPADRLPGHGNPGCPGPAGQAPSRSPHRGGHPDPAGRTPEGGWGLLPGGSPRCRRSRWDCATSPGGPGRNHRGQRARRRPVVGSPPAPTARRLPESPAARARLTLPSCGWPGRSRRGAVRPPAPRPGPPAAAGRRPPGRRPAAGPARPCRPGAARRGPARW